jgi:HEAT repeat protein
MIDQTLLASEDAKVAEALRFVGVRVNSVYDLVNTRNPYPTAIPVLARMLHEVQHPRIREGIARALAVKEARSVAPTLVNEFEAVKATDEPSQHVKWAIGNALSAAASDDVVEDVIRLMRDPKHGWARSMLPLALANAKKKRQIAIGALLEALSDEELVCQAADALARLKSTEAIAALRKLHQHPNRDVQRAVLKASKSLERYSESRTGET